LVVSRRHPENAELPIWGETPDEARHTEPGKAVSENRPTLDKEPRMYRNSVVAIALAGTMAFTAGCATKKSVARETAPIINKTNELDDLTSKTTRDIKDLDTRATSGIKDAQAKADAANQHALTADQQAQQAQQLATNANNGVSSLTERVANLDNYKPVVEQSVKFGFDKADLDKKSKAALDEVGAQIANTKGYIIQVEGSTDSVGDANYNYNLSQRRASAVIQYLAAKYNVPANKIYVIGLGKDKPAEKNTTAKGRAENRRVDVRLMSNQGGPAQAAPTSASNQ
jgi:outer membrane protein OmpA-like peptidoglycan-associated protein